jgi:hypothetical protein
MGWPCEPQRIRPRRLRRNALRRAALRYAEHAWTIVPGACLVGARFDCDQPGCYTVSCHPAVPHWEAAAGRDPHLIRDWWRDLHHAVLLATGTTVDVLEVPAALGRLAAPAVRGPVAVAPSGRLLFLVRPGEGLRPELQGRLDIVLHGLGSWVPVPPTDHPGGRMRWETAPEEFDWELPDPYAVQSLLLAGARTLIDERPNRTVPRSAQVPLRRAA